MQSLKSDRLTLRPLETNDLENLMALEADPEVMRFLDGGRSTPKPIHDGDDGFLRPRGPTEGIWAIVETTGGRFVGWVALLPVSGSPDVLELGYRLCRDAWGKGYATEAATAAIAHACRYGRPGMIKAETMAVNEGSRRVLEKLGFQLAATYVAQWPDSIPGSELGECVYHLWLSASGTN